MTLPILRRTGQVYYRLPHDWNLSDFFSHDQTGIMGFGEEDPKSAIFITSHQHALPLDTDLAHPTEGVFVKFLHCKVALFPCFLLSSLKEVTTCSSHFRESGVLFPLLEGRVSA